MKPIISFIDNCIDLRGLYDKFTEDDHLLEYVFSTAVTLAAFVLADYCTSAIFGAIVSSLSFLLAVFHLLLILGERNWRHTVPAKRVRIATLFGGPYIWTTIIMFNVLRFPFALRNWYLNKN